AGARRSYNRMFVAYLRTFDRLGLTAIPMRAETGPIGGDLSHEFIVLASTGESQVFCHKAMLEKAVPGADTDFAADLSPIVEDWTSHYAATDEMHDEAAFGAIPEDQRVEARGIEVGHIFYFGEKYSKPMNAVVAGPDGEERPVHMGSYGIGVSRLVGAVIEACHDDDGIIWPASIAPFDAAIVNLKPGDAKTDAVVDTLEAAFEGAGKSVLVDDTDQRAGAKFAAMDLIGLPWQVIVGPRGAADGTVEVKNRATGERQTVSGEAALNHILGAQ
ncbi:MAG: His/Gly/Thr/Pro-type tRNA ligase C-terminal domain-containing protein, partial [Pseudomonadota bacterium]